MLTAALAFAAAALLLTVTPGLDTMFVVRTALAGGPRTGLAAGLGICTGTLVWGAAGSAGVTALLAASHLAFTALRIAGATYLSYVGARMIWRARAGRTDPVAPAAEPGARTHGWAPGRPVRNGEAFRTGMLTNLLNPKVGVFYVTLLPQFVPTGSTHAAALAFSLLLASIHAVEGIAWFAVLVRGLAHVRRWLARAATRRWLERVTGAVFVGFGVRLALEGHRLAAG